MRTRRLLAAIGAPLFVVACATSTAPVISSGDGGGGGGGGGNDASTYGGDTSTGGDGGGSTTDSGGVTHIDSGTGGGSDSGGGGGGGVTAGGDCIGDPGAPFGYDFECEFDESFGDDEPCTPGMNQCASGECCFPDTASQCYTDGYGTQCVTVAM